MLIISQNRLSHGVLRSIILSVMKLALFNVSAWNLVLVPFLQISVVSCDLGVWSMVAEESLEIEGMYCIMWSTYMNIISRNVVPTLDSPLLRNSLTPFYR